MGRGEGEVTERVEQEDAGISFTEPPPLSCLPLLLEGNMVMQGFLMCIFTDATVGFELLMVCT